MIRTVKGERQARLAFIDELKARVGQADRAVEESVAEIIRNVKEGGDEAVQNYSRQFDGWAPERLELTRQEMEEIAQACAPEFLEALRRAAENIRIFHARQKQQSRIDPMGGIITGQRVRGLHRAGVYVPGGTAGYPSSVLMNVIPAQVAEVGEIVMATPPGRTGRPDPNIIAAALAAGVDRVFLMGGAQAVAAMAYGTETVPKVDKIVGPGNIFVATAKKQLYGVVDIDMIAGPSEILIIADSSANPEYLAADLMSQAEHDKMASAILITPDEKLAAQTVEALYKQLESLSRREIIEESLDTYGAVLLTENMDEAVEFANLLAPEHLEVCCDNPFAYLGRLDNAGSLFLGHYSPEPLGDYFAGPNHVLPTGGTARFFSPLSVDDFVKKSGFVYYPKEALLDAADDIILLAETEELTAHANSVRVRKDGK
ncbi:histidinol dehydrogenase [Neglecta sp. X4]|nr:MULTISPECIES: histidinol dehydrogenase [unclassified Neglectibacter]NBI16121.1 histidinol dehydrogenase [Neglectibacter sp. 59]NBJ71818.1 histidinol dehydrogenase [Neglectibacter sp. X4]NCE79595.1 histidinol dehydrogenase [Neglectibacter sp. X58]